jgi:TPR repeat protein
MYEHGLGVAQDIVRATEFYRQAAKFGLPEGRRNLAIIDALGRKIPRRTCKQPAGASPQVADLCRLWLRERNRAVEPLPGAIPGDLNDDQLPSVRNMVHAAQL